jgi:hypothetical protein
MLPRIQNGTIHRKIRAKAPPEQMGRLFILPHPQKVLCDTKITSEVPMQNDFPTC